MDRNDDCSPLGPELPFTEDELDACVRVVSCLSSHRGLFLAPWLRPLRKPIAPLVDMMEDRMRRVSVGEKRNRELERIRHGIHEKARYLDEHATRQCRLRAERLAKLRKLRDDQGIPAETPLIADGPVRDDRIERIPPQQGSNVFEAGTSTRDRFLFYPRKCYICKMHFTELHHFYDWLCPECANYNHAKRHQTADLDGRVAFVTGARVKIGFFSALKLLRAGATVITTTRFLCDATERFQRESQYEQFKDRLHIFGVDLR